MADIAAQIAEIIAEHREATASLDDRTKYRDLCDRTRASVTRAVDAFLKAEAARITESREVTFARKWGAPSASVRADYVKMLMECSDNTGMEKLHQVRVTGYNPKGAHHWNLRASCYESCQPTPRVLAAFAVVDGACTIDAVPEFPRWN